MKKLLLLTIFLLSYIAVFSQTTIPPSTTWTPTRNIINANFVATYDSIAAHQLRLSAIDDSITSHLLRLIAVEDSIGELRTSIGSGTGAEVDSSIYATRYYTSSTFATISNPIFTGIQKVSTTDTLATQAYARSYGGTGTVTVGDVRDEIADSLNALRPTMLVGDGTVGPFFDGSEDGGQILYFYGNNGFYTALQGGAPTANRSYRLPIAALPSAGATSLINIDEYGNMGFISSATYAPLSSPNFTGVPLLATNDTLSTKAYARSVGGTGGVTLETVQGEISDSLNARIGEGIQLSDVAVMIADSTGNAVGNYVTRKALVDSIAAAGTGTGVSITDVRDEIADSLNAIRSESVAGIALADSTGYAPGNYVTHTQLDALGGGADSSIYVTVTRLTDSLDVMRSLINDLIAVVEGLGVDLSAPTIDSIEIGNFADDTLVIYFSEKMNVDSVPASSVFYLTEGASEMGIASISFPNDTVMYAVLDSTAAYGSTYLLDYTRAHPYLQDSTGNALANFSNRAVSNYTPEPEAGPPSFLTSDGYTFTWVEAQAANLTLNGTQVTNINDIGPNNHDWVGQGSPGTQWDSANEELDFTYGSAAGLAVSSAPTTMPVTIYMVVRLADWADGHAIFYFSLPATRVSQGGSTPEILLFAGQYNLFEATDLNSYGIITATINGANSSIQWNDGTAVTGNAGTNTLDSTYYIGYDADNANMSIKEVIVRNTTESAQNILDVKAYLYSKYSITP